MSQETLAEMPVGGAGRIVGLAGHPEMQDQLRELGLCEDQWVVVKRRAPLNDPLIVEVLNGRLALRRHEARCVRIETAVPGGRQACS